MQSQRLQYRLEKNDLKNMNMARKLQEIIKAQEVVLTTQEQKYKIS